ncbi:MAG: flagellar type III secretion system pore protein FliP [Pseudomonadales bacterium]|nr:flagellar type III secretion system pore protein FliP [Pseudomonadales bacterium]
MLLGWAFSSAASAEPNLSMPALTLVDNEDGTQSYSITIQVLVMMTLLSFLPAILIMMTSFTRIIIVFSILRQAVGLQQTPSNQILIGLALFLSAFIMTPVWQDVNTRAIQPYLNEELESQQALQVAVQPFRKFMLAQTRESDLTLFLDISKSTGKYASLDEVPMTVIIPAFVTSELKTAFQIGFMLFIPFLIIDLVVASVLMAMGMMMLSPLIVSLPFKIMLFVFVDGWAMIIGTLASSFNV